MVLERGEVANSWRRERWDSLRLLTPNWQSRLPGYRYEGVDPDGFMTMAEVVEFVVTLRRGGRGAGADSHHRDVGTQADDGYHVATDRGDSVPVSGAGERRLQSSERAGASAGLPTSIERFTPKDYRNPEPVARVAACWWSAHRPPVCSWPMRFTAPVVL